MMVSALSASRLIPLPKQSQTVDFELGVRIIAITTHQARRLAPPACHELPDPSLLQSKI